jgi:hypothetical protein
MLHGKIVKSYKNLSKFDSTMRKGIGRVLPMPFVPARAGTAGAIQP